MSVNMKLKSIETKIDSNEYISNIDDIVDEIKNITIKARIKGIKRLEFKQGIIVALNIEDNSGTIPAIMIGNREEEFKNIIKSLEIGQVYLFQGNTMILSDPNDNELDIIKNKLSNIIKVGDMFLAVKAIQKESLTK